MRRFNHMLPAYPLHADGVVFDLADSQKRRDIFDSIVAYHSQFAAPVYNNHDADGKQWGEVEKYELREDGIFVHWVVFDWVNPADIPKYVSPRLVWGRRVGNQFVDGYQASDGTIYPIVVVELSVTGIPRFDIGQNPGITIALSRDGEFGELPAFVNSSPSKGVSMTEEQVQALIAAAMQPIAEAVAQLTAKLDAASAPPVAAMSEDSALIDLEAAPVAAMAEHVLPVDPNAPTAEILMSRRLEFGDYAVALSRNATPIVSANMGLVKQAFIYGGKGAADSLVKSLGTVAASAGKVTNASLSHGPVSPGNSDERSATARALDIQRAEGLSWDAARTKAGISVINRPNL
jgi:hypothetical protein